MDDVPRPTAPPSLVERARQWADWFGLARLVTSALAVVVVCAGAWWLVRSPQPPTEAALPVATTVPAGTDGTVTPDAAVTTASSVDARADPADVVVVHVAGAVVRPGVYEIDGGSRVADAIERAGGVTSEADPGALNLAAIVPDGARVLVPLVGEEVPPELIVGGVGAPAGSAGGGTRVVDVNRATAEELESLPGVGPATSAAIIDERDRNGPFSSVDDLERVPGIGPSKLAAISDLVTT